MRSISVRSGRVSAAAATGALVCGGALGLVQLGRLVVSNSFLATAVTTLCLGIVAMLIAPAALLVAAVPSVFALWRVGPSIANMSISDAVLILATVAALGTVDWRNRHLRRMLLVIAVYQSVILACVVARPSSRAAVEWGHRGLLMAGGLVVGAALAQRGLAPYALRALALVAGVVAGVAVLSGLSSGLEPAYPLGLHKNAAGALLMMVLLVAYIVPATISRSTTAVSLLRMILIVGLAATQSRGAMIVLVIGFLLWAARRPRAALRSPLLMLGGLAMVGFVVLSFSQPEERDLDRPFSSLGSRAAQRQEASTIWKSSPIVGQGIRYFRAPEYADRQEIHNVIYATLAETGVVGLAALVVFVGWTMVVVLDIKGAMATAALAVFVARMSHGLFDIFWGAGTQTLPWLLLGMAAASFGRQRGEPVKEVVALP